MHEQSIERTGAVKPLVQGRPSRSIWQTIRQKGSLYLFLIPTIIFLLIFMYYPAFTAVRLSFYQWDGFGPERWVGLRNFERLFTNSVMLSSINNMLILTIARILIVLTTPLLAAELVFHLMSDRWKYWYRVIFVIPLVIPDVVTYLLWQFIFNPSVGLANVLLNNLGLSFLSNEWLGSHRTVLLSLALVGFPWIAGINFLIYLAGLQNIPREVLDAAAVDGATGFRRFWLVDVKLIMGQIKLLLILSIIFSLQAFVLILIMTNGGPGYSSMVPGLLMYEAAFQDGRFGYACAIGTAIFVVIFVLTYINMRYIQPETEHSPS
ncbi:MAG: sugar ABC transporter permease [Caldilineaceae bacterium]|nr:sugar ABC transporter permease [Caldilineaceae bacterium]MCB0089583.1 sugar ABC transporter permease [Caldilineaceae bacterium]MCB0096407.1 sugar ABC transporter permease [Caldilineaceae bacterium]MCB0145821.1 sugar ABC transporter permease [Caldilineaceae bacterium]